MTAPEGVTRRDGSFFWHQPRWTKPVFVSEGRGRGPTPPWSRRSVLFGFALTVTVLVAPAPDAYAEPNNGQWDPTLPGVLSAGAPGDPLAIANASLQASANAAQTTMDLGRKFLGSLGIGNPAGSPTSSLSGNRVYGKQAIEYVIRRAGTQIGVPYSWGGGSLTGPSRGIDSGAGTVGFDCSGLTRYAFAGVGVQLPRFSGAQYDAGRKYHRHKPNGVTCCSGGREGVNTKPSTSAADKCSKRNKPVCP